MTTFKAVIVTLSVGLSCMGSAYARSELPATTRKVVLERSPGKGYRWKLVQAALPQVRDRQVLVRVHAVSLNRGDLELLKRDDGHDLTGLIVASDAAGEVVALGKDVRGIRCGERVTSLYFRDWVDGPASAEKLAGALGGPLDGVLCVTPRRTITVKVTVTVLVVLLCRLGNRWSFRLCRRKSMRCIMMLPMSTEVWFEIQLLKK